MGTLAGIEAYKPPESGVYIPPMVAMLSAPAFAAQKASRIVNKGILGWHLFYDPETGETDNQRRMLTFKHMVLYPSDLVKMSDLYDTNASTFFCRSEDPEIDRRLLTTDEIKALGYEVKASAADLQEIPRFGRAKKKNNIPKAKNRKPTERKEQGR